MLDIGSIVGQAERPEVKHQRKVLDVLAEYPDGISKKKIRELAGLNGANAQAAIDALLSQHRIEPCNIVHASNKMPYTGYRLAAKQESTLTRRAEDVVGVERSATPT